jgi:signal peptidase I
MSFGKLLRGLLWVSALVFLVGVVVRYVVVEVWVLPDDDKMSAAVAPTLKGGDTILYMRRNLPAFGDLVRCSDPDDKTRFVVGRVAGLWGDVVETNGRELTVNGKRYLGEMACAEDRIPIPHPTSGSTVEISCDTVSMAGHPHLRGHTDKVGAERPTKTTIGQGKLYLLSDDRSYHDDSRDFGTLNADTCTGRIVFRLWGKEGMKDSKTRMSFVQ